MSTSTQDTELLLVLAAQNGSRVAIAKLCHQFEPLIKKYSYAAHVRTVAEDVKSELWLVLLEAIQSYNPHSGVPVPAYFRSKISFALWNQFKRYRRTWSREILCLGKESGTLTPDEEAKYFTDDFNVEEALITSMETEKLSAALSTLCSDEQELIYRHYVREESLLALAKEKGYTKQAYSYRHRKILATLRNLLDERNYP